MLNSNQPTSQPTGSSSSCHSWCVL